MDLGVKGVNPTLSAGGATLKLSLGRIRETGGCLLSALPWRSLLCRATLPGRQQSVD